MYVRSAPLLALSEARMGGEHLVLGLLARRVAVQLEMAKNPAASPQAQATVQAAISARSEQ